MTDPAAVKPNVVVEFNNRFEWSTAETMLINRIVRELYHSEGSIVQQMLTQSHNKVCIVGGIHQNVDYEEDNNLYHFTAYFFYDRRLDTRPKGNAESPKSDNYHIYVDINGNVVSITRIEWQSVGTSYKKYP